MHFLRKYYKNKAIHQSKWVTVLGTDYTEKRQPGIQGWKKSRLHEIFQLGLKLKSEVNLDRNLSVDFVVLAICIFPRLLIIFSARAEILVM